jgi:hypothetical protein
MTWDPLLDHHPRRIAFSRDPLDADGQARSSKGVNSSTIRDDTTAMTARTFNNF